MIKTKYITKLETSYPELLKELEQYVYYCLRCLKYSNWEIQPADFTHLTFQRENGQIAEAILYPATAINETLQTIDNPLFFYGFKADYDFTNLEYPIRITFSDKYEDLVK